ncbi:MAG: hypothetical protein RSE94_11675 [Pseudomonas sp.]
MTDELLLLAICQKMYARKDPRFANFEYVGSELGICLERGARRGDYTTYWNPLRSMSQSFELMVLFKIDVKHYEDHVVGWFDGGFIGTGRIPYGDNSLAATMRAVAIAAAGSAE